MIRDLHTLSDAALDERVRERQAELVALEAAQRERNSLAEDQKLATEMHRLICRNGHSNPGYDCDWPHEDQWTQFVHRRYRDAAQVLIRKTGSYRDALEVIQAIHHL